MLNDATLTIGATAILNSITHLQLHSVANPGATGATGAVGARVASTGTVDGDGDITWSNVAFTGLTANQAIGSVSYWSAATGGTCRGYSATTGDATANSNGEVTLVSLTETGVAS